MVNFYSRFIPKYKEILLPLTELLRKPKRQFKMVNEASEAVTNIKESSSQATMVQFPKVDARLALMTDASNHSVGAALNQWVDESWQPLPFISRKLKPQRNTLQRL